MQRRIKIDQKNYHIMISRRRKWSRRKKMKGEWWRDDEKIRGNSTVLGRISKRRKRVEGGRWENCQQKRKARPKFGRIRKYNCDVQEEKLRQAAWQMRRGRKHRLMRWRGARLKMTVMIRKRNVGKGMLKKRIWGCEGEQFVGVDGDVEWNSNKMECWAEKIINYWCI